jgi:hypothetical protein
MIILGKHLWHCWHFVPSSRRMEVTTNNKHGKFNPTPNVERYIEDRICCECNKKTIINQSIRMSID